MADSQPERMDANEEDLFKLDRHLQSFGYSFDVIPYALQLNKRDLPGVMPVQQMVTGLRRKGEPYFEAVAYKGTGVWETLRSVTRQIAHRLAQQSNPGLATIKLPVDVESLIKKLETTSDPETVREIASRLGQSGELKAVVALGKALTRQTGASRFYLLLVLEQFGNRMVLPSVVEVLNSESDSGIRLAAARTLAAIGDVSEIDVLANAFASEPDPMVQSGMVEALFTLGGIQSVSILVPALNASESNVRSKVAEALGRLGDQQAVEPLIAQLSDQNNYVRAEVAEALGRLRDPRAKERLELLQNDPDWNVREKVNAALRQLPGSQKLTIWNRLGWK
ncbi:MAG TPA: HEAT repeat domain-containing protein [Acidobacteriota bacterium]|nr:HEAT repeat domain-containing protein [Acidobacteriota bacterium]